MAAEDEQRGLTRRRLVAAGGAGAVGLAVGAGAGFAIGQDSDAAPAPAVEGTVPFDGPRQAGIATPPQDRLVFAAFDVTATDRAQPHPPAGALGPLSAGHPHPGDMDHVQTL